MIVSVMVSCTYVTKSLLLYSYLAHNINYSTSQSLEISHCNMFEMSIILNNMFLVVSIICQSNSLYPYAICRLPLCI